MKLVFSIVSHGQQELVARFLCSLDQFVFSNTHSLKIIITENTGDIVEYNSQKFDLICIRNLRPKGFGANHNAAFEKEDSDYFFIINPDIRFHNKFDLNEIILAMTEQSLDIASPKILNIEGQVEDYKRADLTLQNLVKRKLRIAKLEKFEWLAGMFLITKSKSFRKLYGFDTDFFMYVEDCDLCMRARKHTMSLSSLEKYSVIHDARRASRHSVSHLRWHISSLLKYWMFKK